MEYERRVEIASLDWRNNPLGLPKWSERPKCEQTFGRRYFICPNVDNNFGNPRMCRFTQWIDIVTSSYYGQKITDSETEREYERLKDHENATHIDRQVG
uniref:Uncharacterized protein n=1 Tax=Oryza punctata TaxID=4537 RepID=A0A0E0LYM5_ORYPU